MKLQFNANLDYQLEAIQAVVSLCVWIMPDITVHYCTFSASQCQEETHAKTAFQG